VFRQEEKIGNMEESTEQNYEEKEGKQQRRNEGN
jgi:hypothetical protein